MGRIYYPTINATASPAAIWDIIEIRPVAEHPVYIHSVHIYQTSDMGDGEEEGIAIRCLKIDGTEVSGSGGGTIAAASMPRQYNSQADPAFGTDTMNTTVATGTLTDMFDGGWNIRVPFEVIWTPETRPQFVNGEYFVVRASAPADAITVSATVIVEEMG